MRRLKTLGKHFVLWLFTLFATGPIIWILISALKTNREIFTNPFSLPQVWQWHNFVDAWIEGHFSLYFWNTVMMTIPSVILIILFATMAGYAFARFSFGGGKLAFTLLIFGLTIPMQALMIPLYYNFVRFGLLDSMFGLIVALVAIHMPFSIFLMRSFFINMPENLSDAAKIDGCSEYGVFWRVMVPLAKPGVLALTAIEFMNVWKAFLFPLLIIHDETKRPLTLALLFFKTTEARNYSLLAAGVIIAAVPVIIIYLAASRHFQKGLVAGSFR